MFHQANVIADSGLPGSPSLLAHWYEVVMEELTSLLAFPVMVRTLYQTDATVRRTKYMLYTLGLPYISYVRRKHKFNDLPAFPVMVGLFRVQRMYVQRTFKYRTSEQ